MSDTDPNQPISTPNLELPPIREFNDRATLWLLEDPHNLQQVLAINYPQLAQLLNFDHAIRENRSLIPPDLTMLLRLLSYMMEIWQILLRQWEDNNTPVSERKLPLIIPFVFYTGSQE